MKKTIIPLAAAALLLASCIGGGALQSKEQAGYQTIGGVTSRSGDFTFCFKVQDANPMPLAVTTKGDEAYVSFTVKMTRTDEALKPNARLTPFYAVIHGRDAQDDVEFRLDCEPSAMERVKAILDKPGQSVDITFTGRCPKADLDRINNTKVWTSLLM